MGAVNTITGEGTIMGHNVINAEAIKRIAYAEGFSQVDKRYLSHLDDIVTSMVYTHIREAQKTYRPKKRLMKQDVEFV